MRNRTEHKYNNDLLLWIVRWFPDKRGCIRSILYTRFGLCSRSRSNNVTAFGKNSGIFLSLLLSVSLLLSESLSLAFSQFSVAVCMPYLCTRNCACLYVQMIGFFRGHSTAQFAKRSRKFLSRSLAFSMHAGGDCEQSEDRGGGLGARAMEGTWGGGGQNERVVIAYFPVTGKH